MKFKHKLSCQGSLSLLEITWSNLHWCWMMLAVGYFPLPSMIWSNRAIYMKVHKLLYLALGTMTFSIPTATWKLVGMHPQLPEHWNTICVCIWAGHPQRSALQTLPRMAEVITIPGQTAPPDTMDEMFRWTQSELEHVFRGWMSDKLRHASPDCLCQLLVDNVLTFTGNWMLPFPIHLQ